MHIQYIVVKMSDLLNIRRSEYKKILKNSGKHVSFKIGDDALLKKIKYLKKRDLSHLASIRGIVFDESNLESILYALFNNIHKKKQNKSLSDLDNYYRLKNPEKERKKLIDKAHRHDHLRKYWSQLVDDLNRYYHKQKSKNIREEIYRNIQKRNTEQIINELKRLKRLNRYNPVQKENISHEELEEAKRISNLSTKDFKRLAQLWNIETTGLKRSDLIYILLRSQKHHKESEYLKYLQADSSNEIRSKTNKIRILIIELGMMIDKSHRDIIRKRLEEIDKLNPSTRQKRKILEELTEIFNDLQFKRKHINSAFDSCSYYGLKDLEYIFGDLDDYYKPILAKDSFEENYQMYLCRGDKDKTMSISQYLYTVKPYVFALIDEKKNI